MPTLQYLMDTDWAIDYLRGNPLTVQRVGEFLPDGIGISIITIAELYRGLRNTLEDQNRFSEFASGLTILPLTDPICRIYASEYARLKQEGNMLEDFDLLIGATAVHHELILLTNNHRHFQRLAGIRLVFDGQ